jgi:hypothetical protein
LWCGVVLVFEMAPYKQMHRQRLRVPSLLNEVVAVRKKSRLRRGEDSKKITLLDLDLDQLRRRAGKKRRGHDERNLAQQGSLSGLRPSSLVECARQAQVLVMPVQAEVSWGGHCD